jgi:hypothetical protein
MLVLKTVILFATDNRGIIPDAGTDVNTKGRPEQGKVCDSSLQADYLYATQQGPFSP